VSGGLEHEAVQQTLLGDASEHAGFGVVVWNAERRYVAANAKACQLLGVTREQLLSGRVGDNNRSADTGGVVDSLISRVPARGAMTIERQDGGSVEVEWVVFPTTVATLPHMVGLMWERDALS
jgi:PAS domain-containing protein